MKNNLKNIAALMLIIALGNACATSHVSRQCAVQADKAMGQAIKWYHTSVEKTALYRQGYAAATSYVEKWLHAHQYHRQPWGVVLDIDETVLDNSWYFNKCQSLTQQENDFSRFISLEQKSQALPGASAFTHFVHAQGGYVSLISNRDGSCCEQGSLMDSTIKNLKEQNIYFDQVILGNYRDSLKAKDKNPRFEAVIKGQCDEKNMVCSNILPAHQVIAYCGDNIHDFPHLSQKELYNNASDKSALSRFGEGYFIFPNPMYGSWQKNGHHE